MIQWLLVVCAIASTDVAIVILTLLCVLIKVIASAICFAVTTEESFKFHLVEHAVPNSVKLREQHQALSEAAAIDEELHSEDELVDSQRL